MIHLDAARSTRQPIVDLGGAFMVAPELDAEEKRLGVSHRLLYFRGRSAVLGDPPAEVVTGLFEIFPHWLVEMAISATTPQPSAGAAVAAYARACAAWGRRVFSGLQPETAADIAGLLFKVVDEANLTNLPLAAGWQAVDRPDDPAERLAFALMLARELRGGLHFGALRACGLTVHEAIVLDPGAADDRLERTGWQPTDIDQLRRHVASRPDAPSRWAEAEDRTHRSFAGCLEVLTADEATRLVDVLTDAHASSAGGAPEVVELLS